MMVFLPADTWIRLIIWMTIGLDVYILYGFKNSKLQGTNPSDSDLFILKITGLVLSVLLVLVGLWYQQTIGWTENKALMIVALSIATMNGLFISLKGKVFRLIIKHK